MLKGLPNIDDTATGSGAQAALTLGSPLDSILLSLKAILSTDQRLNHPVQRSMFAEEAETVETISPIDSHIEEFTSGEYDDCEIGE